MVSDSGGHTTSCIRPTGFAYLGPTPFGMLCQRSASRPSVETQHDAIPPPTRGKNEQGNPPAMMNFDVDHLFRVFGGPRGLLNCFDTLIPKHGLSYPAVQQWSARGSIPAKWVGTVIYCIEKEGHHCLEFLVDKDELSPSPKNARSRG